jgi:hypothetical protein
MTNRLGRPRPALMGRLLLTCSAVGGLLCGVVPLPLLAATASEPASTPHHRPASTPKAPAETGAYLGWSVAIAGATGLLGAPHAGSASCGHAYEYSNLRTKPALTVVDNSHCHPSDLFGWSVGMTGKTFLIGAPGQDKDAGAVYTFTPKQADASRSSQNASLFRPLAGRSPVPGDFYGGSVAVSGDTAIVGADGTNDGAGAAYVYVRSGQSWHQQREISGPSGSALGTAVAISGDTAIIGAPGTGAKPGSVYILTRSGSDWGVQATITDPLKRAQDRFGSAVSISGDFAVVGADGTKPGGKTYIYRLSASRWILSGAESTPPGSPVKSGNEVGASVSISSTSAGTRLLIGVPGLGCGQVLEMSRPYSKWRFIARFLNPECQASGYGASVALSGKLGLIGYPTSNGNAGSAWIAKLI